MDHAMILVRFLIPIVLLLFFETASSKQWEGTLVFNEDFNENYLRKHYWDYEEGCEGKFYTDYNLECFRKGTNNVQVANGSLVITARVENNKDYALGVYKSSKRLKYTSGKIIQSGFGFTHGIYAIRARLPKGKHLLPSIYLIPNDQRHNGCKYEEIDILMARGQRVSTVLFGAQYGKSPVNTATKVLEKVFRGIDFSEKFHEFALKWTPTRLEWYLDQKKVYEVTTHYVSDWATLNGDNLPNCPYDRTKSRSPFSQRSTLVISLSVGGSLFPESKYGSLKEEEAKEWPKPTFEIDSIKVYDSLGGTSGSGKSGAGDKLMVLNIPGLSEPLDFL